MNAPDSGDPLEQLLRDAAPAPLENNGFSTRVMAAVHVGRRRAQIRFCAIIAGAAAGVVVAAGAGAFGPGAANVSTDLERSFATIAVLANNPAVLVAAMVIVAALIYVFRRSARDLSSS